MAARGPVASHRNASHVTVWLGIADVTEKTDFHGFSRDFLEKEVIKTCFFWAMQPAKWL